MARYITSAETFMNTTLISVSLFKLVPTRNPRSKTLETIRELPLEPEEYCRRWVPIRSGKQPGEWGYRTACIRELAKVTGAKPSSININWGATFEKRPHYIPRLLRLADILNRLQ